MWINILFNRNTDGTYKVWAQCGSKVCHGKAYGSSRGLVVKDSKVTKESKVKDGYRVIATFLDRTADAIDDDLFKEIVGGTCRAAQENGAAIEFDSIEARTARELQERGMGLEFLNRALDGFRGEMVIGNLTWLESPDPVQNPAPKSAPAITRAVVTADSAWDF